MKPAYAWSFSALDKYNTCPYQYYRVKVKKDIKDSMNDAARWGNEVHKHLENRVKNKTPLPSSIKKYEKMVSRLDTASGVVLAEQQLALNKSLEPTTWFGRDAWCRVIIDVSVINEDTGKGFAGDYKTGNRKTDTDQLMLTAATMFAHYAFLDKVTTAYLWLKENKIDKETFTRDQEKDIWNHFNKKLKKMDMSYANNKWPKNPSGLCKGWCPVRDCTYWEPAKT